MEVPLINLYQVVWNQWLPHFLTEYLMHEKQEPGLFHESLLAASSKEVQVHIQ